MDEDEKKLDKFAAQTEVLLGIEKGDLRPLIEYLRSGNQLDTKLREYLAAMLDSNGETHFELKLNSRKKRGGVDQDKSIARHDRRMTIACYFERRITRYGLRRYLLALADTKIQFGVGKTAVEDAHKYMKSIVSKNPQLGTYDDLLNRYPDP